MQTVFQRTRWAKPLTLTVVGLALVVGMFADTKYLGRGAAGAGQPGAFSAPAYAKAQFPKLTESITQKAVDITVLAPAVDAGLAAAGKKYGQDLGAGSFAFPVKVSGVVTSVDSDFAIIKVAGAPSKDVVRIPLGLAISGSPVRDATGMIKFGDFQDQTDYQDVANQLQLIMQQQVIKPANISAAKGKKVDVIGAFASGGPPHSFIIQPVVIKVAA